MGIIHRVRFAVTVLLLALSVCWGFAQSHSQGSTYIIPGGRGQGRLGVRVQDVTHELREKEGLSVDHGAYVLDVDEDSPAEKAQMKEGDVIVSLDGEKIDDSGDLIRTVRRVKPKSTVKVEVVRKGEHKVLTAEIGRAPGVHAFSFNFGDRNFPRMPRAEGIFRGPGMGELYGLGVEDLTRQLAEYFEVPGKKGVLVTDVESGTPAEKAGFKAGDIILKAGGNTIRRSDDLREEMSDRDGRDLSIDIMRKGKALTLSMKLDKEEGIEERDDDDSFNMTLPRHSLPDIQGPQIRRGEFSDRTVGELKGYLHRLTQELKKGLQQFRYEVDRHFSRL